MENEFRPWSQETSERGYFIFRKIKKLSHLPLRFNNNPVKQVLLQKHLGVYLDGRLDFRERFSKHG